jgi:SAM-dependent methyltransferase
MPAPRPDIGFIPTPDDAMVAMLKLADLGPSDVVYDLGCGDGRLLIQAAVGYGIRGVGVDVDAALLQQAWAKAEQEGVGDRLTFRQENLFGTDLRAATVVFIYLLPHTTWKVSLRSPLSKQRYRV